LPNKANTNFNSFAVNM